MTKRSMIEAAYFWSGAQGRYHIHRTKCLNCNGFLRMVLLLLPTILPTPATRVRS